MAVNLSSVILDKDGTSIIRLTYKPRALQIVEAAFKLIAGLTLTIAFAAQASPAAAQAVSTADLAALANDVYRSVPKYADDLSAAEAVKQMRSGDFLVCTRGNYSDRCDEMNYYFDLTAPRGFRLEGFFTSTFGVQAGVYSHNSSADLVLALAGTSKNDMADIVTDAGILLAASPVYSAAIQQVADRITEAAVRGRSADIIITGHSLGGLHAQVMAAKIAVKRMVTFNAPGAEASFNQLGISQRATSERLLANLVRRGDVVGNYGRHYGRKIPYPKAPEGANVIANIKAQHAMGRFARMLSQGGLPYGSVKLGRVNFKNKQMSVGKKCARSLIGSSGLEVGTCIAATRMNYTTHGYIYNGKKCLEAGGKGALVRWAECSGSRDQVWADKGQMLRNRGRNLCMDYGVAGKLKGKLLTWDCFGRPNQIWRWK